MRSSFVGVVAALAVACGSSGSGTPGVRDAGVVDAGTEDGGTPVDAGVPVDGGVLGAETSWTPLLDDALTRFYRWLPSKGRDKDPDGVFTIDGGVLHVLGIPATGDEQDFGYVATRDTFGDVRVRVEQRWGTKKFAPRLYDPRDSGLLYRMVGGDQIWPKCIEFQIMEHDVGDLWVLSQTGITSPADSGGDEPVFDPLASPDRVRSGRVVKSSEPESLTDWNSLELFTSGRDAAHVVNGRWVNGGTELEVDFGDGWGPLTRGRLALQAEGAEVFYRNLEVRPLVYLPPPDGATVLVGDGADPGAFVGADGGTPGWRVLDGGAVEVVPGTGDLRTARAFDAVRLHVEFRIPPSPAGAAEQDRGNSGVYLQGRYEVQVLDSFAHAPADANDCGAIYGVRDPDVNEAFPPGLWQAYDIEFHPATWDGASRTAQARITVVWNGSVVQRDVPVPGSTTLGDPEAPGPGPLRLQDHGHSVQFRNVWLVPLAASPGPLPDAGTDSGDAGVPGGGSGASGL